MTEEDTTADDELLAALARVLSQVAAPPPDVVQAAKGLFTWRTVDAELAELVYDSLLDDTAALVRTASGPRIVTFEAGSLTIEVEVDDRPAGRRLVGQLVPGQPAELELRRADGVARSTADDMGRFVLPLPAAVTRVQVRATLADGTVVESATVLL